MAVVLGLPLLGVGTVDGWNYLRTRSWVETTAVVERVRIVEQKPPPAPSYLLDVVYRWSANGHNYRWNRYAFDHDDVENSLPKIQACAARWPEGATVACWVNPKNPSVAVLDRDRKRDEAALMFGAGLLILLLTLGGPVWRRLKSIGASSR